MRKYIVFVLVLVFVLGLVGCSETHNDNTAATVEVKTVDAGDELRVAPVTHVTIHNIFTGEVANITINEDIKIITDLLFSDLWNTEGTTDCASNIEMTIDGATYMYHSDCSTFNDNVNQRSLSLDDVMEKEVNSLLAEYISLTSIEASVE